MIRRLVPLAVTGLLVLTATGCSDGDDDGSGPPPVAADTADERVAVTAAELGPFDVPVEDLAGPGTPLGSGLSVPEGAVQLGPTFPDLVGDGYRALLLVTGEPVAVYDALVGQATGLGMSGSGGCLGDAATTGCAGVYADGADGEALTIRVRRSVDPGGAVVSGVGLRYRPPGSVDAAPEEGRTPPTAPLPQVPLPDPVPAADPLDIGRAVRAPGSEARSIERGSEVVGLAGPCACDGDGWSFVVRVDGIVADVVAGYGRRFADLGDPPDAEDEIVGDRTLIGLRVGEEGSETAEIRGVVDAEGEAYLIVSLIRP